MQFDYIDTNENIIMHATENWTKFSYQIIDFGICHDTRKILGNIIMLCNFDEVIRISYKAILHAL